MKNIISKYPVAWQGAMAIILKPALEKMNIHLNIGLLCESLGIGRTSAYEAKKIIDSKMFTNPRDISREKQLQTELSKAQSTIRDYEFEKDVLRYRLDHSDCWIEGERPFYSEEFKRFILELKARYGFTFAKISTLIAIPEDTLKKFQKAQKSLIPDGAARELPAKVMKLLNTYLRSPGVKSAKQFCKKYPELLEELNMNYRQILSWLSNLGFLNPKGIFLTNTGLDRIIRFTPDAIWGTDGKNMTIIINGCKFRWVWQCLVDFKTTVIVGGVISQQENTQNLLGAIKASKEKTGVAPLGIVLDNRLSENLPAIRQYLDELGIEIIKIFPYNSKSNAIVEGNFNIFQRWVGGKVWINGDDPQSLSRSIAQTLVEVFTHMRNHTPRKATSMKTPAEIRGQAINNPPTTEIMETIKEKIKEIADRFKREQKEPAVSFQKKTVIDLAVKKVHPKDEETFRKRLSHCGYTHNMILQALAIFFTRKQEYPEKNYDHTYFGGILRNLANDQAVEWLNTNLNDIYFHQFEGLKKKNDEEILTSLKVDPLKTFVDLAQDYLKMPVPAWGNMILLQMKELFFMATQGSIEKAKNLCDQISKVIVRWTYEARKKRELLLCKLYEWLNNVQIYAST